MQPLNMLIFWASFKSSLHFLDVDFCLLTILRLLGFEIGQVSELVRLRRWPEAVMHSWSYFVHVPYHVPVWEREREKREKVGPSRISVILI